MAETFIERNLREMIAQYDLRQQGLFKNSAYYEAENRLSALGVSTPPEMRVLTAQIGWPRTYLDSIEERLDLQSFRLAGESQANDRLNEWWAANDLGVTSSLAHTEALIHGRAFLTVAAPNPLDPTLDPDVPIIRAESAANMAVEVDPVTQTVVRAIRMYGGDEWYQDASTPREHTNCTLFLPDVTVHFARANGTMGWEETLRTNHNLGVVPVIPIVNRAKLSDRAGRSEITPELRSVTDAASRIMMNMQAAAELMAVPQRILFGVAADAFARNPNDPKAVIDAYYGKLLVTEDTEAHASQFSAADLRNFVEVLQELSKQAASYTGLPPQYLSFNSENPSSAEAIKSSEARLVKKCERKARMFGNAWTGAMRLGMRIIDGDVPTEARRMEAVWADPSTPTYAAKADAVAKLVSTASADGTPLISVERARQDMGYTDEERRELREQTQRSAGARLASLYGAQQIPSPTDTEPPDEAA